MPGQFVPPNGFAGFAQQTPAVQSLYRGKRSGGKRRSGGRRKKKAAAVRASGRRRTKRAGKAKRFVKGSAAAKAYMAKIRKLRK